LDVSFTRNNRNEVILGTNLGEILVLDMRVFINLIQNPSFNSSTTASLSNSVIPSLTNQWGVYYYSNVIYYFQQDWGSKIRFILFDNISSISFFFFDFFFRDVSNRI
jgi:hypothetical protein